MPNYQVNASLGWTVSIPKRVSEALNPYGEYGDDGNIDDEVSIPKRVSEALNPNALGKTLAGVVVSIPKRVSEALNQLLT